MSDLVRLRKYVSMLEETHHDGGPLLNRPVTKAVVGGVIAIPMPAGMSRTSSP
jgi:hypothetical protein